MPSRLLNKISPIKICTPFSSLCYLFLLFLLHFSATLVSFRSTFCVSFNCQTIGIEIILLFDENFCSKCSIECWVKEQTIPNKSSQNHFYILFAHLSHCCFFSVWVLLLIQPTATNVIEKKNWVISLKKECNKLLCNTVTDTQNNNLNHKTEKKK